MNPFQLDEMTHVLGSEPVEGVVLGRDKPWWDADEKPDMPLAGKLISFDQACDVLRTRRMTADFSAEAVGKEGRAFYLWTPTRILFLSHYDGLREVKYIPRHPVECRPQMFGGGS